MGFIGNGSSTLLLMKKVAADASIIVKWFLEEKFSDEALKLRNDYIKGKIIIAVPSLLEYEVLNVLKYGNVYDIDELKEIGEALNKYGFETYELEGELKKLTIESALRNKLTIYDASYVALAKQLNTTLYTADEELIEKFPEIAKHVKHYS